MRKVKPVVLMKLERSLSLPPGAQSNLCFALEASQKCEKPGFSHRNWDFKSESKI